MLICASDSYSPSIILYVSHVNSESAFNWCIIWSKSTIAIHVHLLCRSQSNLHTRVQAKKKCVACDVRANASRMYVYMCICVIYIHTEMETRLRKQATCQGKRQNVDTWCNKGQFAKKGQANEFVYICPSFKKCKSKLNYFNK